MLIAVLERILRVVDWVLVLPIVPAALLLKFARLAGLDHLPVSRAALHAVGVLPVRRHYYEPYVDERSLHAPLDTPRSLPGIDWNVDGQLAVLRQLRYRSELEHLEDDPSVPHGYRLQNPAFQHGDSEILYSLIRSRKPRRVVEIGSGFSTLVAAKALDRNGAEDPAYQPRHICVEPFEKPWLESVGVQVVRERVEALGTAFFASLGAGDLLFIDSSHMIRPQGDVLFEYLELLPTLRKGVIVHVHDIFTPRDYPRRWVIERHRYWNEQYLLEAFLSNNPEWRVLLGVNMMHADHFDEMSAACPHLTRAHLPGSFYIEKVA
jgi:predicted O-methyltransferase YrrM